MAGLGGIPFGVPLGNIGPKSGADFSPYLEMWRMRQAALQTQAAQNLQQQASQQQQMEADKRLAEQARQFDVSSGQRAKEGNRDYISVKLDDPTFAAPIYANLVEIDGKHQLLWSR